jgi:ABC-2 type transport system ATP-binding protein
MSMRAAGEEPTVRVTELSRTFRAPIRRAGLGAAISALFHREYETVSAVSGLSFTVPAGEVVGFIGPNGAGKTTTMKMLAGILHPSGGAATVLGFEPHRRQDDYLRSIALLRGSAPIGGPTELTVQDNFQYRRRLYDIPRAGFDRHLAELDDILGLGRLMGRQLRALSLGERMRAGLGLSLIHRPRVLFLDEPTIGLDASAAVAFRRFVADYAAVTGATVMLTSHYMTEVEALCSRVILIDHGTIRFDGNLGRLAATLSSWKEIRLTPAPGAGALPWHRYGRVISDGADTVSLQVARADIPQVTARLLADVPLRDLSVLDPPLEVVLDRYYRRETPA